VSGLLVRAPALPAQSILGEASEGAVEAPSERADMGDGARKAVELARKAS
jgi:hypothetical protein